MPVDWGSLGLFIGGIAVALDRGWSYMQRRNGSAPAIKRLQEETIELLAKLSQGQNELLKTQQQILINQRDDIAQRKVETEWFREMLTVLRTRSDDSQRR